MDLQEHTNTRQSNDQKADRKGYLINLQEELLKTYYAVTKLKEAGEALQGRDNEYEQLAAELKESKKRHSELKARCKELKQSKRQHMATEASLKTLLDVS